MSLYIKGDIRIPKLGFVTLLLWQNGDVTDGQAQDIGKANEVQPHGRCIDADAFASKFIAALPGGIDDLIDKSRAPEFVSQIQALLMDIAEAPTIIPASGGDEADPADPEGR